MENTKILQSSSFGSLFALRSIPSASSALPSFPPSIRRAIRRTSSRVGRVTGQRFGASYADGLTDIMIGGAVLPSILHQDPRYFYPPQRAVTRWLLPTIP